MRVRASIIYVTDSHTIEHILYPCVFRVNRARVCGPVTGIGVSSYKYIFSDKRIENIFGGSKEKYERVLQHNNIYIIM